jgi:O-antigen ligase
MLKLNNSLLNFSLFFFPLVLFLRSAALNLYIVFLGLIFVYYFFTKFQSYDKKFKNIIYSFFIFYSYIICISFFSIDQTAAFKSSISQIRFFLFFLFFSTIIKLDENFFNKLILFYKFILTFFSSDLIFQALSSDGANIIGIKSGGNDPQRFSSFFGDELIFGTFIFFLGIPVISQILSKFNTSDQKTKFLNFFFIIILSLAIILTGDRLTTIFYFSAIVLISFVIFDYKKFLLLFLFLLSFFCFLFLTNSVVQKRYLQTITEIKNYKEFGYFRLFSSSFNIWQDNKLFGVGLKNYRIICNTNTKDQFTELPTLCSTHPHHNWLELLVETGIVGAVLFIAFTINIVLYLFSSKSIFSKKNNSYAGYALGLLVTLLFFLWPIKSSGSMFTTFFMSYVWFNLGLLFSLIKIKNAN